MVPIRQKPRGLLPGRWYPLTVETRQGLRHQPLPGVVLACLGRLFQENLGAPSLDPHHTQTARKGFILRHRDGFGGHLTSQARTLLVTVRHDSRFHATVDLVRRAIGGADNPMEAREPQEQTHQANPTGPHVGLPQVERQHQPMEEGETRNTVKKRHDNGALIEALLVRPLCLQGAARHVQPLRRLTLGEALGLPMALPLTQLSACDAVPALMAVIMDPLRIWDDGAHRSLLLLKPLSGCTEMAQDDEVALVLQPVSMSNR